MSTIDANLLIGELLKLKSQNEQELRNDLPFLYDLGIITWGIHMLVSVIIVAIAHRWFTSLKWNRKIVYFAIHSLVNTIIVIRTMYIAKMAIVDPIRIFIEYTVLDPLPMCLTIVVHAYHTWREQRSLKLIDLIHHIPMICIVIPSSFCTVPGYILNLAHFFIMGLPGAIDYFLLTMVSLGHIDKMREKRINMYLNVYIRSPGLIIVSYLGIIQNSILRSIDPQFDEIRLILRYIVIIGFYWNGQFFMNDAVQSYVYNNVLSLFESKKERI